MPTAISDGNRIERIQQKGQRVRREVSGLTAEVEGALGDLERVVREQLEQRPYATLGAASGLGYVLGGGVPVALTRMLFGMGGRLAFVMVAQRLRDGFASSGGHHRKDRGVMTMQNLSVKDLIDAFSGAKEAARDALPTREQVLQRARRQTGRRRHDVVVRHLRRRDRARRGLGGALRAAPGRGDPRGDGEDRREDQQPAARRRRLIPALRTADPDPEPHRAGWGVVVVAAGASSVSSRPWAGSISRAASCCRSSWRCSGAWCWRPSCGR